MKTLTAIRVSKVPGFVKAPEYDFSDDGARFTGFCFKGLPLTQHRGLGNTYLCFRVDYIARKKGFTYEDYSKEPWYKLCDKYNGVEELPEMDELVKDLEVVVQGIEELSKRVNSEKIDTSPIVERAKAEQKFIEDFAQKFESEFKFWACKDSSELYKAFHYFNSLKSQLQDVQSWIDAPEKQPNLRDMFQRVAKYGYIEVKDDSFYVRELSELLESQKSA